MDRAPAPKPSAPRPGRWRRAGHHRAGRARSANWTRRSPNAGMRGNVLPARRPRRPRSTRRRQDAPDLPRGKVSKRTVGRTYAAPDGKTFRPSMFLTLTCPTATAGSATTARRSTRARTTIGGRRGTRCTSPRCSTGSCRTCAASSARTCSTSPPSNRNDGSRRTCTSRCAAPSPAPSCGRSWPRPTTRCGGRPPTPSGSTATSCRSGTSTRRLPRPGHRRSPAHLGRGPRRDRRRRTSRGTWPGSGTRFDAQGVLAGSKDAARCIGYLTKYLTKQRRPTATRPTPTPGAPTPTGSPTRCGTSRARRRCANWLRYGVQPKNARPGLRARPLQGQGPPPRTPRLRRPAGPGLPQMVRQDASPH